MLAVSDTITPLSFDMYTPAVPELPAYFSTMPELVNLTLVGFFLFFSVGLLVFGPLSDRHGRRPTMLGGFGMYVLGSVACALAPTIRALVAARVVQAFGAGAIVSVSTALVKDSFAPAHRARVLALLQIMQVLGPVCAPLIGGLILLVGTWRTTFWLLAGVGTVCASLCLLLDETAPAAPERRMSRADDGSRGHGMLPDLARVLRNGGFSLFLFATSMFSLPFMSYIASASYVYIDLFGLTQLDYTHFFAACAAFTAVGPVFYLRSGHLVAPRRLISCVLAAACASGVLLLTVGSASPLAYCGSFLVFAVCEATIRPCAVNILLSQATDDAGSVSALINFTLNVAGTVGMMTIMLARGSYIVGLGVSVLACMAAAVAAWAVLLRTGRFDERGLTRV